MEFEGFSTSGMSLLSEIGANDRDWFQAHKPQYDAEIAAPAKAFVAAMTAALRAEIAPTIDGQPKVNGSIAPINNDLRFNPEAMPYKDHLLLKWWDGPTKKTAPMLWVRLSQADVGFASGMMLSDIDRWREAVGGDAGEDLVAALDVLGEGRSLDVAGQELKRVPAPWPADHPRADLLRHKGFQVRWSEPTPSSVATAEFVDFCVERLSELRDIHGWLVDHLQ